MISIFISDVIARPRLQALSIIFTAFALLDHDVINGIHKTWQIIMHLQTGVQVPLGYIKTFRG